LRAVKDDNVRTRSAAVRVLAAKWPDQTTRELLVQCIVQGSNAETRGAACSALGKMHSEFGHILPTRDLDGIGPYLDPLKPISRKHIEKAAAQVGIRPDDIDAQVATLSAHMGWDVRVGAKKKAVKKSSSAKPVRERHN
ncbi:HEAT repeat-containing protein, partial [Trichlorobacter thiogenes]